MPCGQEHYDRLLSHQLWRVGRDASAKAIEELDDPRMLELARLEYLHVYGAIFASVHILGRRESSVDWLKRLWPPMREQDQPAIRALVEEIQRYIEGLPRGVLAHLHPSIAGQHGRQHFRRAYRMGVVLQADRVRWYHADIDSRRLACHVWRELPKQGLPKERSVEAFEKLVRTTFSRGRIVSRRPSQRNLRTTVSAKRWMGSVVGQWFSPFRPNILGTNADVGSVKSVLDEPPQRGSRANPVLSAREPAMLRYLPDEVWARITPLLAALPSDATPRCDQRLLLLGIAVYLAADYGWGNLPALVGVSAATVRRLVARLRKSGLWQAVKECLVAGPHGRELRQDKLP